MGDTSFERQTFNNNSFFQLMIDPVSTVPDFIGGPNIGYTSDYNIILN